MGSKTSPQVTRRELVTAAALGALGAAGGPVLEEALLTGGSFLPKAGVGFADLLGEIRATVNKLNSALESKFQATTVQGDRVLCNNLEALTNDLRASLHQYSRLLDADYPREHKG